MTRYSNLHIAVRAALAMLAVHPAAMRAQAHRLSDASDSVPRSLAEAIMDPLGMMSMYAGGRPRLLVGTLPAGLTRRLWVPPGSTILGGIESSGFGLAVIRSPLPRDSVSAAYRLEQPKLGWTLPHDPSPMPMMGFVSVPPQAGVDDNGALIFCSGGTTLTIAVTTIDPLTWEIRATALDLPNDRCRAVTPPPPRVFQVGRPQYPTLVNPPGSGNGFAPNCSSYNSSGFGGTTRLQTTMTLDQLFAHYGKQLADSGYTPGASQTVGRSWTRRDSTGTLTELMLTARTQAATPACVEIQMEVRTRRPS